MLDFMTLDEILNWRNKVKEESSFFILEDDHEFHSVDYLKAKILGQYWETQRNKNIKKQKEEIKKHKNKEVNADQHYDTMQEYVRKLEKINSNLHMCYELLTELD